ncbi:MAG: SAM-dependent methyltransferase [Tannerellaceae bacterium]
MKETDTQIDFITEHMGEDLTRLLLSAARYPQIDVPFAVEQIAARRQIREKLPSWYANPALLFPAKIAAEQCSSEQTALYKQRLVTTDQTLCDLTGGLGIDSYFFSRKVKKVTYIERFDAYCSVARRNFIALGVDNIEVMFGNSSELIAGLPSLDVFYIDPARRGEGNKRVFALADCEPDLPALLPRLLAKAEWVIAKLSPMADIQLTLELLCATVEVHVLAVRNECKELLFVMKRGGELTEPVVTCVNYAPDGSEVLFSFFLSEERNAPSALSDGVGGYLYEPNASVLKAGAFKCVGTRFGLKKLQVSSHLYTSNHPVEGFPGRAFCVEAVLPFSSRFCKELARVLPQANITVRNFPLSVDELRKRTKIKDGGGIYLFATTLQDGSKVLIRCVKI